MKVVSEALDFNNTTTVSVKNPTVEEVRFQTDSELWEAFKEGDETAFIKIYNDYFESLCDFGIQFAPLSTVKDAVQDVFIHLRTKRAQLPALKNSIQPFLFQCLKRHLFNLNKKAAKSNFKLTEDIFEIAVSHESAIILNQEHKVKLERLNRALGKLNAKQREAIYYYFYKEMSYEEVQDLMGFDNVKSARNLIYKIVKKLKQTFLYFF
ncbi:RNA polymerase sigma factor, sigma-70 family [Zhouia amylolytica]|uniref:RNA polymerase sigma factor, sigma-70 family n=1 Tax=Zhouia amylolytica TaxID=376730 RepID=A0A1I6QUC2_9FLAO|nr:sigma-70 family RNA polymerase sigma factor [Zhouia amylolytica]SFS56043.1 RNA polymerase sigma factor, sigma-70 family [Zhouia amylolytica]